MAGQQAVADARFADKGAALWGDSQVDRRLHAFAQDLNPVHACRLGGRDPQDPPLAALDRVFQHDQRAVRCQPHPVRVFDEARQLHFRQLRLWIVIAEGVELTGAEIGDCHQPVVEQHDPGGSQPAGSRQLRIPIQCTKCRFARPQAQDAAAAGFRHVHRAVCAEHDIVAHFPRRQRQVAVGGAIRDVQRIDAVGARFAAGEKVRRVPPQQPALFVQPQRV